MTVATEKQRILDILETLNTEERFVSVLRGTLRDINSVPAFFVITGDATRSRHGNDQIVTERSYSIFGAIMEIEAGREFDAEIELEGWYDDIDALFDVRPGLWLDDYTDTLDGVQDAMLVSNSGFGVIEVSGANYAGSEWILRVTSHTQVVPGQ